MKKFLVFSLFLVQSISVIGQNRESDLKKIYKILNGMEQYQPKNSAYINDSTSIIGYYDRSLSLDWKDSNALISFISQKPVMLYEFETHLQQML